MGLQVHHAMQGFDLLLNIVHITFDSDLTWIWCTDFSRPALVKTENSCFDFCWSGIVPVTPNIFSKNFTLFYFISFACYWTMNNK